jgi:hypothetical protein
MSTAFAYSNASDRDAKNMLDSIKEIRYNVETETNFKDYDLLVSKAIIDFKKYKEKHPLSNEDSFIEEKLHNLIYDYYDARIIWEEAIYKKKNILLADDIKLLRAKHPNLLVSHLHNNNDIAGYYYQDVLLDLWSQALKDEKLLDQSLSPKIKPHVIKHP